MHPPDDRITHAKICIRCGAAPIFWGTALVPGDPSAPRGSHRALAHHQPAWICADCGYVEPQERRLRMTPAEDDERFTV